MVDGPEKVRAALRRRGRRMGKMSLSKSHSTSSSESVDFTNVLDMNEANE